MAQHLSHSWSQSSESQSDSIEFETSSDLYDSCMDLEILSSDLYDSNINLWEFLIELLEDKRCKNIIRWTGSSFADYHDNEFIILDPFEVSRRFALRRNKPLSLNYHKFNRILRYYYNKKKILYKINGKSNTFSFRINILPYLNKLRLAQFEY